MRHTKISPLLAGVKLGGLVPTAAASASIIPQKFFFSNGRSEMRFSHDHEDLDGTDSKLVLPRGDNDI